jgi:hypothetical protein
LCNSTFNLIARCDIDVGEQAADGFGDRAAAALVAFGHHNAGALLGEPPRDGFADAGPGPSDQRHLACQLAGHGRRPSTPAASRSRASAAPSSARVVRLTIRHPPSRPSQHDVVGAGPPHPVTAAVLVVPNQNRLAHRHGLLAVGPAAAVV